MADVTLHTPSPTPAIEPIGDRIRRCRQVRGGTQDELAQRAGLNRSTLTLIEQGKRGAEMSIDTAWRLAWALGTSVDMLIGLPELRG
jgi:transcriptional regulator with XRE-family HTH domain